MFIFGRRFKNVGVDLEMVFRSELGHRSLCVFAFPDTSKPVLSPVLYHILTYGEAITNETTTQQEASYFDSGFFRGGSAKFELLPSWPTLGSDGNPVPPLIKQYPSRVGQERTCTKYSVSGCDYDAIHPTLFSGKRG